jgi:DNA-binding NarL/FixJ family response regulator
MPQSRVPGNRRLGRRLPQARQPIVPKLILWVLPRGLRVEPVRKLLPDYEISAVSSTTQTLRLARRNAIDLYIVHSPLNWGDAADICKKIRIFDPNTPLIVYSTEPTERERREASAAGAQAYVARADDPHNLAGTAGQLIMLAELRSMEAMSSRAQAMQERIVRRLAKGDVPTNGSQSPKLAQAQARLKLQTGRMFARAGGSKANFERLWPTIYEGALKRFTQSGG